MRPTRKSIVWTSLIVSAMALLVWLATRPAPKWTDSARPVCAVPEATANFQSNYPFVWANPNEIVLLGPSQGRRSSLLRKRIDRPQAPASSAALSIPTPTTTWSVSPDGRHLCWLKWTPIAKVAYIAGGIEAGDIDSSLKPSVENSGLSACWTADSRYALFFALSASDPSNRLNSAERLCAVDPMRGTIQEFKRNDLADSLAAGRRFDVLHQYPNGRTLLIVCTMNLQGDRYQLDGLLPNAQFVEVNLNRPSEEARRWTVRIPIASAPCRAKASPDGRRLLWVLYTSVDNPLARLPAVIRPAGSDTAAIRAHLIVTDLHGASAHEIAVQSISNWYGRSGMQPESDPQWSPDSRRVGFIDHGAFYVIDVP